MTAATPGRAAYGCPECGSPEPRYPASTLTCQHQFHVMARAIWRVFPHPPGDAGPKHREAVSDALRAVGDYVDAVAARQPQPALRADFPGWDGSTGVASTAPNWNAQPGPALAGVISQRDYAERELNKSIDETARLRAALAAVDPDKLGLLADWFDTDDAVKGRLGNPEVQADLRRWAKAVRTGLEP